MSDPAQVAAAVRISRQQMVDEQAAAGCISADQATALKQRIDAGDFPAGLGRGGFAGGRASSHGRFGYGRFGRGWGWTHGGRRHGREEKAGPGVPAQATPSP